MNLALFDFDGTLTEQDMFSAFLREHAGRRRYLGWLCISPFYLAYQLGYLPAAKMRPIASWFAFSGRSAEQSDAQGRAFTHTINAQLNPWCLTQLKRHQARGDRIVVVSASLDLYLKPWCEALGVELVCSTLERKAGRLTGRYQDGDCSAERKVTLLKKRLNLADFEHITAYGDTQEDMALLALADVAYYQGKRYNSR